MKVKCFACKNTIDNKTAFAVPITKNGKRKHYYCNEEEYLEFKKNEEEKNKVRPVKCKICGKEMPKWQAKEIKDSEGKVCYCCSQEEYDKHMTPSGNIQSSKDRVYYMICDLFDRRDIYHTTLWKEWAIWNKICSNEVIGDYIEENRIYLKSMIRKIEDSEFPKIRYLSAILKNNLPDYQKQNKVINQTVKKSVDESMYGASSYGGTKRRSLEDLEDDI